MLGRHSDATKPIPFLLSTNLGLSVVGVSKEFYCLVYLKKLTLPGFEPRLFFKKNYK